MLSLIMKIVKYITNSNDNCNCEEIEEAKTQIK